jgi:hypothetical protein
VTVQEKLKLCNHPFWGQDLHGRTRQAKNLHLASYALFEAKAYVRVQDKLKLCVMRVMLSLNPRLA